MRIELPTVLFLVILLALSAVFAACREDPSATAPPGGIENVLVSQKPLILIPDDRFKPHGPKKKSLRFQNRAALVCWVRPTDERPPAATAPLRVELDPRGDTKEHRFRFEWDGEELPPEAVRRDEKGVWTVEVAAAKLTPGRHVLQLHRDYKSEARKARQRLKNLFRRISYHYQDERKTLEAGRLDHYRLLSNFLQYEVLGTTRERRGGLLFVGPAQHDLEAPAAAGTLVFEPENLSEEKAIFRVAGKSLTLEPRARGRLAVELEKVRALRLEVEGHPQGYFLWSAPRLEHDVLAAELPPLILITLDTTRRDAIGPYNGRSGLTPTLDALALQATVFEQAYSTAPWTLPSHASIMTGLYPAKHGAGVSKKQLDGLPTLAHLLRRRGYFAAGFSSGDLSSARFGLAQGFHYYRDPDKFETTGGNLAGYLDAFLNDYGHLPLFLFVNYFDPHALYQAPAEWEEKLGVPALREVVREEPEWQELFAGKMTGWRKMVEGETEVTPEGLSYLRAAYQAEVAYTDHLLGLLFQKLRDLGLWERALIVVTADHGELLGEGGYFSHGARLDPELVEIPLLIKWPGQKEGRRSRRLVSQIDLYPTILEAAGIAPPPSDGRVLTLDGERGETHPYVFLEEHESIVHPLPKGMKLARHLFGVQRPFFRQLVWGDQQSCARRHEGAWYDEPCETPVEHVLNAVRAQLGLVESEGDAPVVLDEVRESLEALGYM